MTTVEQEVNFLVARVATPIYSNETYKKIGYMRVALVATLLQAARVAGKRRALVDALLTLGITTCCIY